MNRNGWCAAVAAGALALTAEVAFAIVSPQGAINDGQAAMAACNKAKQGAKGVEEACRTVEAVLATPEGQKFSTDDKVRLHLKCLSWAQNGFNAERVIHHYEALKALKPDYTGDEVFQARLEVCYRALQDMKKFPIAEKDIKFGQTLKSMGVIEKKTVHLKDYWNPTNVTAAFQKLVDDPEVTTIVLDKMPTPWYVTSVSVGYKVTGKRILLKSGAKLMRCPFGLRHKLGKTMGALLSFSSCENVILESDAAKPADAFIGFYESREERLKWNKEEGDCGVAIGHDNNKRTTKNVVIRNLRIADTECDGICLGPLWNPCEEIFVENVILDSNFRQGCSPCAYYSLYFKNVTFSNTFGGPPTAGLDVEPWDDYLSTCNLYFFDCTFENNPGGAVLLATTTHEPILVMMKRCLFKDTGAGAQIHTLCLPTAYFAKQNAPKSDIRLEECTFESSGSTLAFDPCPVYNVSVKNCTIRDVRTGSARQSTVGPSPISIGLSRDFGVADLPKGVEPRITFDNVTIEGFEGIEPVNVSDEMGTLNIGKIFRGSVRWNGKTVDLSNLCYKAPDLNEPKTVYVPGKSLVKPAKIAAADEAVPDSNCLLSTCGAWWLKQPLYSYYFWLDKGRKISFDFVYTAPYPWINVPTGTVSVVSPTGLDVKLADVAKGTTNLAYVATETGWHRFSPGASLDAKSTIGSGLEIDIKNVKGAYVSWLADTMSDCFTKYELRDATKPCTIYFEVPAGGKSCRIRANYGGFVLKDPAGNVVDAVSAEDYVGRHTFIVKPSTDKAEIWSLTTPTGAKGGGARVLRFFAPFNGLWSDSPETLPCAFADHYVPAKKADVAAKAELRFDLAWLGKAERAAYDKAATARKEFAAAKANTTRAASLEKQIAEMRKGEQTDNIQHQIDDLNGALRRHGRLAAMEAKIAAEPSDVFAAATFCQAFLGKTDAAELKKMGLGSVEGVLEYDDAANLAPLVDLLVKRLGLETK